MSHAAPPADPTPGPKLSPKPIWADDSSAAQGFNLQRWLLAVALVTLAIRGWISATFPITGDEAFFYWWGVYPDWGYYDHPPMVGWWIAGVRALLGDAEWAVRLPAVLLPLALGGLLWWGLGCIDRQRAAWAALLYSLLPLNALYAFITTDTPLVFWSVLSAAALLRAEARSRWDSTTAALYALSGLALGAAFLSKYFAVVLGLAYAVYFLGFRRERWAGFLLLGICALPGPLLNLWFNITHGWSNIMFNAINRHSDASFEWAKPLGYLAMLAYLVTPAALWWAWKSRAALRSVATAGAPMRLLACLVLVPLLFFALLSLRKVVGLHWVLAFYPFGMAWLALAVPSHALPRLAKGLLAFTALHVLVLAGLYATTLDNWRDTKLFPSIVRSYSAAPLLAQVDAPGVVLMADAYTPASIYGYTLRRYVPVFGRGNFHARQDDLLVDFSRYQGQRIRVLKMAPPDMTQYTPYFENTRTWEVRQDGVPFYVVEGSGFRFEAYRAGVLADIYSRYYRIPAALPMTGCPFCERLCGAVRCSLDAPTQAAP